MGYLNWIVQCYFQQIYQSFEQSSMLNISFPKILEPFNVTRKRWRIAYLFPGWEYQW